MREQRWAGPWIFERLGDLGVERHQVERPAGVPFFHTCTIIAGISGITSKTASRVLPPRVFRIRVFGVSMATDLAQRLGFDDSSLGYRVEERPLRDVEQAKQIWG